MLLKVLFTLVVVTFVGVYGGRCPFIDVNGCLCIKNSTSTKVTCDKGYEGKTLPPYKSDENVYYVSINNTKVEKIREYEFASWSISLKALRVDHNRIYDIDSKAFLVGKNNTNCSLPYLELLSFSYNRLTSIEMGTFDALAELETLYISHNEIKSIDRGLILKLGELLKFSIYANKLTELPNRFLTKRLLTLRLHLNPLRALTRENMYGATNLRTLTFSTYGNKVSHDAFLNRRNLKYIYVEKSLKCSCRLYWYRYTHLTNSLKCNGHKNIKKYLNKYCKHGNGSSQIFSSVSYLIVFFSMIASLL